jgi:hypothetical protein
VVMVSPRSTPTGSQQRHGKAAMCGARAMGDEPRRQGIGEQVGWRWSSLKNLRRSKLLSWATKNRKWPLLLPVDNLLDCSVNQACGRPSTGEGGQHPRRLGYLRPSHPYFQSVL